MNTTPLFSKSKWNVMCDLIKIISMFFIVICHAISYSGAQLSIFGRIVIQTSIIADNLFILVTGYLSGGKHESINAKKIFILWIKAIIISYTILALMIIFGYHISFGRNVIQSLLPILGGEYWFVTAYIYLCLLMPFIDAYLNSIDKKHILKFAGY